MFKLSAVFLLLLTSLFLYFDRRIAISIEEPLGKSGEVQIPWRDAKRLDSFFREVMIREPLAYTLGGYKPLSFAYYLNQGTSLSALSLSNLRIVRGWRVWQKHKHHFVNEKIEFSEMKSPLVKGVTWLIVADAKRCREILPSFPQEFSYESEWQLGILLGFGHENASLYTERNHQNPGNSLPLIWGPLMEKERDSFSRKQFSFHSMTMDDLLLPPFVGNPSSEESIKIKENYIEGRKKIQRFYKDKDFLGATLSLYKFGPQLLESDV